MDLSKFGLENAFWKLSDSRFGYDDSNPSLLKFVMSLFAVYTFHDNLEVVPKEWKIFMQDRMKWQASNITVLL